MHAELILLLVRARLLRLSGDKRSPTRFSSSQGSPPSKSIIELLIVFLAGGSSLTHEVIMGVNDGDWGLVTRAARSDSDALCEWCR